MDEISCPRCEFVEDDEDLLPELISQENCVTTYDGIIVTVKCPVCSYNFIPEQEHKIIDDAKFKFAVAKDLSKPNTQSRWDREEVIKDIQFKNGKLTEVM